MPEPDTDPAAVAEADPDDRPYAGLDPEAIVDAVESLGFDCDGRVLALNSFENRVYRVGLEDQPPLVVKFYRPGRWTDAAIREEHAFCHELVEADLSVVAPLQVDGETLHGVDGFRLALFPSQGGHAPELERRDVLTHLGRCLGRLHMVGAGGSFAHRLQLDVEVHGHDAVDYLLDHGWLPAHVEDSFDHLAEAVLTAVEATFERAGGVAQLRLHGDCHPGNLLWRNGVVHLVDLDDALTGPAMQDLWMLLSGSNDDMRRQMEWLLEGYTVFRAFDARELQLIEALRSLRLLHFNAWIARRWRDPAFPAAFPFFEEPRHWENLINQLQEQLDALQQPALSLQL